MASAHSDKPIDRGLLLIDRARGRLLFEGVKERYVIPADAILECEVEAMMPHTGSWNFYAAVLVVRYSDGAPASVAGGHRGLKWEVPLLPRPTQFRRYSSSYRRELAETLRDEIEELIRRDDPQPTDGDSTSPVKILGCRILVTGAGHGLGKAIAMEFALRGARVVITDRDGDRVRAAVEELRQRGDVCGFPLDVTIPDQIAELRKRIKVEHGPIDILINNAGVVFGGPFLDVPLKQHELTMAVNLIGAISMTHAFLPDLMERPAARIVNIISAAAVLPLPHATTYAASKWGMLGFTDSLREELRLQGKRHVGVTAICPSFIATGHFAGVRPATFTRWLTAERVAMAVRRAVEKERSFVMLPRTAAIMHALARCLPRACYAPICRVLGVSTSMVQWRGHEEGRA
jgi:short-subunit dehydrogenase